MKTTIQQHMTLMNDGHEVEQTLSLVFDLESDVEMNEQQLYCFSEMKKTSLIGKSCGNFVK